jgi:S1-C subfamily serine protease
VVAVVLVAIPAVAQQEATGSHSRADEAGARTFGTSAARAQRAEAIEVQMRQAEERLAEAAARVAELSNSRLPHMTRRIQGSPHPVMGITIGGDEREGPVEGAMVSAVTPGSAAAEAGIRTGDVITAINGESLSADDGESATQRLLDFMSGVEEGDTLDVEYLRSGKTASVAVRPRTIPGRSFALRSGNRTFVPLPGTPAVPGAPHAPAFFSFFADSGGWGDMEMVSLTEDLGRYFGTDKGLLIVRAPQDENLKLRDGDVIRSIDGREPASVTHAMRILGSYQSGETLEIEIMRDKKRLTVSVEMPDNRQSHAREW